MNLTLHHRLALVGATATSAIALGDAMTHGITGEYSIFADDSGVAWGSAVSYAVHGLTYVAFIGVLVAERHRLDAVNRGARVARWLLLVALGVLAVVFLTLSPVRGTLREWGLIAPVEAAAGISFAAMFFGGIALGAALWRRAEFRLESRLLVGIVAALGLVFLLVWIAPGFAHPAYMETMLHFGLATTGAGLQVRAGRRTSVVHEAY
jgi:hypothetical protein